MNSGIDSSPPPGAPAAGNSPGPAAAAAGVSGEALLFEEKIAAVLLLAMVGLMFGQAVVRNIPPLGRTVFATWLAHASEVLPSGLTWLTFIGCAAATRRKALLRIELVPNHLSAALRRRWELGIWTLWGLFFAVLAGLGGLAVWGQRGQTTSVAWLPAWAVSLSVPAGAALVVWRTVQNLRELRNGPAPAGPGRAGASSMQDSRGDADSGPWKA